MVLCHAKHRSVAVYQRCGYESRWRKYIISIVSACCILPFTAALAHDVILGPHEAVEFDKIIINVVNTYDSRDEQFTTPVDGLRMISATICSQQSSTAHIEIVKNGVQFAGIYGDDYDLWSQTIMVQ